MILDITTAHPADTATRSCRRIRGVARRVGAGLIAAPILALLLTTPTSAQSGEERYEGREIAGVMSWRGASWLERDSRNEEENTALLMNELPIEPGDTVVDMGCGSGYFARLMSPLVGRRGRVLCVDIQPQMIEIARRLAEEAGLANIEFIVSSPTDPKLPAGQIDLILLVDVYHEFAEPKPMLEAMRTALRGDGVAALVEYRLEGESASWIRPDHRMSIEQVEKEWLPAGYRLERRFDELPSQHLFLFARSGARGEDPPRDRPRQPRP